MGTLLYILISSVIIPPIVKGLCYSRLDGCELVCHCKNQTSCQSYLGHGGCGDDGCQPAWSGPSCQRENIVYGLTEGYLGSSGYPGSPTNAVDGNHSTRFLSTPTNRPYLWINTGGYTLINTLEIKTNWITEGFQIDVSNSTNFTESQLCHKDQESIGSLEYNVKCAEPLIGQYVRMQLLGWDRLDIYEIEIYGCADYWFGDRCDKVCNCHNPREVCDKITGKCVSGCAPGYGGTGCQGQCYSRLPGCRLVCHCKNQTSCVSNLTHVGCSNHGCQTGWSGPSCQAQNIVYELAARNLGSSGYDRYYDSPKYAVDGNTSTYFSSSNRDRPYLWINTVEYTTINTMKIQTVWSAKGFQIDASNSTNFTDSQLCYKDHGSIGTGEYNVKCTEPVIGQYVRMQLSEWDFLQIDEIEIYRCADYFFGDQCDKMCNCLNRTEVCDKVTGRCESGCAEGYGGRGCQGQCYSRLPGCQLVCHCKNQTSCVSNLTHVGCSKRGCQTGWSGPSCQAENIVYGLAAGKLGSSEYSNSPAYAVDGNTSTYFSSIYYDRPYLWINTGGYTTINTMKIQTVWSAEGFQIDASNSTNFTDSQLCHKDHGNIGTYEYNVKCTEPVIGQYVRMQLSKWDFLDIEEIEIHRCADYFFGDQCDKMCNCLNMAEICDKITGRCDSGCAEGYGGRGCQDQCYSLLPGCRLVCHCKDQNSCVSNLTHVGCSKRGCQTGWSGPSCQAENIAYGLAAGKLGSSAYSNSPIYAVDGITSDYFSSINRDRPYLWINTGVYTTINRMKIQTLWIVKGFQVDVSNNTNFTDAHMCYKDQGSIRKSEYNVKCTEPVIGQYVRMQLLGWGSLGIEEIEIYRCADYFFGDKCDKVCNCLNRTEVCDKVTGRCDSGCAVGYGGRGCQDLCYAGSPSCLFTCHCKNQSFCLSNLDNFGCGSDGCQMSWSGPSCQRQNIAFGLGEGQLGSSEYGFYSFSPSNAVDGKTGTRFSSRYGKRPYLWINTTGYTTINTMKIKTICGGKGFQIHVSNSTNFTDSQLCHNDRGNKVIWEYNVKCTEPLVGLYVRMQLSGRGSLDIYEIEIYECADYWFGDQCDRKCHCKQSAEICDKITGRCVSGCIPGYGGTDCQG